MRVHTCETYTVVQTPLWAVAASLGSPNGLSATAQQSLQQVLCRQ